jgi:hypothetical protein
VVEQKEQLEQKHLHLLHILDSERQAKWHYVQQMEELSVEVKKLKDEVSVKFQASIKVLVHVSLFVAVLQSGNRHGSMANEKIKINISAEFSVEYM